MSRESSDVCCLNTNCKHNLAVAEGNPTCNLKLLFINREGACTEFVKKEKS